MSSRVGSRPVILIRDEIQAIVGANESTRVFEDSRMRTEKNSGGAENAGDRANGRIKNFKDTERLYVSRNAMIPMTII